MWHSRTISKVVANEITQWEKGLIMLPELYLVLNISAIGLKRVEIIFVDQTPDPYHYTRGEGQCLIFKLSNFDCSNEFNKALEDGRFYKDIGKIFYNVNIDEQKKKHNDTMNKMAYEYGYQGKSGNDEYFLENHLDSFVAGKVQAKIDERDIL